MKAKSTWIGICGLAFAVSLVAGCGDGTDVTLAKVPPGTPAPSVPQKPSLRIPKNAVHSPEVLPGSEQK